VTSTVDHLPSSVRPYIAAVLLLLVASSAQAQSVTALFTSLPSDFAHLFTPANGIIVGVGGAGSAAIHPKDDEIAAKIAAASGGRHDFFRAGAPLGDGVEQSGFALGMYIVGRASHSARLGALGADLVDAQIVNGVLTQGLKAAVDRRRPTGSKHSFPSGHTSATLATASVIEQHYGWKVAAPFYALGGYVSLSRMVDNQHWASDVIFGAGVGIVSGRAASLGHGQRVSVSPSVLPGGFAVVGTVH
jgi:membrane-associated phospholipid phosphatase